MNSDLKDNKAAVLYSGGCDSTYAAAIMARDCEEIHLLSYYHLGATRLDTTKVNVDRLREKFPETKFVHHLVNLDRMFKELLYGRYLRDILKHGFFNLAMCTICKVAMHTRTLVHCLDNKLGQACDGANRARERTYPSETPRFMKFHKEFYAAYGVNYSSPVFDEPLDTDRILFEMGIVDSKDMKAAGKNQEIEPTCHQKSIYHTATQGYYVNLWGYDKLDEVAYKYYEDKFGMMQKYIDEYLKDREDSKMLKLIS